MNENIRDTKFQGFAKLLWQELDAAVTQQATNLENFLLPESGQFEQSMQQLIAQRAYDFAVHVWTESGPEQAFSEISDLTKWPDTSQQ